LSALIYQEDLLQLSSFTSPYRGYDLLGNKWQFAPKMSEILKHIGDLVGSLETTASKDTANEWIQ
jgi:hypothetical protein